MKRMAEIDWKKFLFRIFLLTFSSVVTAIDTKTFINAGGLYPGGVGGVTLLIMRGAQKYAGVTLPYTPVNLLLNAVPIYIGFRYLGKKFTAYSCYAIVLAAVITDLFPSYIITYDVLLISIFGGVIGGFASVLCLWADATTGGTDFISVFLSVRRGMDAWNLILAFNVCVLMIAGVMFGWDKALYSVIFQYALTQFVQLCYHKYQKQTLLIITEKPGEVSKAIYDVSNHGATILHGEGAYAHAKKNVLYSIVSRGERRQVMDAILKVDQDAFINSIKTEQVRGYFYQKPIE